MFENEIKALERMSRGESTDGKTAAINAAIALMRAAQPKDEAAEREHCLRIARPVSLTWEDEKDLAKIFEQQRAAARAAGYAAGYEDGWATGLGMEVK